MKLLSPKYNFLFRLSIRTKIQLITITSILFVSLMSFLGICTIVRKYNETLYQSIETSLSYATKEISGYLDAVDNLADQILANKVLQNALSTWKKDENSIESSEAYNSIYWQFSNYLIGSDRQYISYLVMKQEAKTLFSSYLVAQKVSSDFLDELVTIAEDADGSTRIVSEYCEDHGLFFVREIKESQNLSFRNLGSILINVDITQMLDQVLESKMNGEVSYVLMDNNQVLLATDALKDSNLDKLIQCPKNSYYFYTNNHDTYFIVREDIPAYNFDIIYAISYNSIYAAISRTSYLAVFFLVIGIILVLLISASIASFIANDFKNLVQNMQLFAAGNYKLTKQEQELLSRSDEIGMLHRGFNDMAIKINTLIEKNYVNELLKKEAQLKALESQMDPHFLYNTLDFINWRAKAIQADDISQISTSLGALLRITLCKNAEHFTLGEEMQLISNYMTIQHMRYPNKLDFHCDIREEFYPISIPKFTIQPLVENAIRYSLINAVDKCEITVNVSETYDEISGKNLLIIQVKNNGSYFEEALLEKLESGERQPHGFGIGLLNVHHRLRITYGEPYGLQFYNEYGDFEDYAIVEVRIPKE